MLLLSVIISAILFTLPFFYPSLCFLQLFAFMPIIYSSLLVKKPTVKKTFFYGLIWGLITFSTHFFWCLKMFIGYNFNIMTMSLWSFAIIFLSLFSGLWLIFQRFLQYKIKFFKNKTFELSWIISTTCFIYFITYGFLFFCGVVEGYPFFNPFFIWSY